MSHGGSPGDPGVTEEGFEEDFGADFDEPEIGGHDFGPGFDGPAFGGHIFGPAFGGLGFAGKRFPAVRAIRGKLLKRAALTTAALLLDGPADAAQIVQRVSEATDGAVTPPQEVAELAIGVLAGRGVVTVDDGVATLTEFGKNLLAWRGISSETAHAFLAQVPKFVDIIKIRKGLFELAGMARTITWSGTDEQKEKLAEAKAKVLAAITEAKKSLHSALAES
jgi:hypothetical protein